MWANMRLSIPITKGKVFHAQCADGMDFEKWVKFLLTESSLNDQASCNYIRLWCRFSAFEIYVCDFCNVRKTPESTDLAMMINVVLVIAGLGDSKGEKIPYRNIFGHSLTAVKLALNSLPRESLRINHWLFWSARSIVVRQNCIF